LAAQESGVVAAEMVDDDHIQTEVALSLGRPAGDSALTAIDRSRSPRGLPNSAAAPFKEILR
jgi:hypothetical protein